MAEKIKFKKLVDTINAAPTGGFVGITDYEANNGDVVSIIGQIGCSYATMRKLAIKALKEAIDTDDFEPIEVSGVCYYDDVKCEWNPRKRSCELKYYDPDNGGYFNATLVKAFAKQILEDWENPKERKNNNISLTDKENGLVFNSETGSFNFTLLVEKETFKEAKEKTEEEELKIKAQAPETKVKALIRERFERKIKTFTIAEGKFKSLSINGTKFNSKDITF